MSLFSREPAADWDVQVLTPEYAVSGTIGGDDQTPAGQFLRAQALTLPVGCSLRLASPQVTPVRGGTPPAPAGGVFAVGFTSLLSVLVLRDEVSSARTLDLAEDDTTPGVTVLVGSHAVTGSVHGSPPTSAAQRISFVMSDVTITVVVAGGTMAPITARAAVVFSHGLHGIIVP